MKKVFTLCVAIMASVATFAQTTLWDGDDYKVDETGGFWDQRCERKVVENPKKEGVNTSDRCLEFKITGNEWNNGSAAIGLNCSSFESKRMSLMIKKDISSNVRIEIKCNNVIKKVAAWYDGNGAWQKLYFDFSTNGVVGNPTEINIFPTTDAVVGEQIIYLDNIQIEDAPKVKDQVLSTIADKKLDGVIKPSGTWLKGVCQNADGEWKGLNTMTLPLWHPKYPTIQPILTYEVSSLRLKILQLCEATTKIFSCMLMKLTMMQKT